MKYIFLSTNENLEGGLLQAQFIRPVVEEFSHDYKFVSVNRPFYPSYRHGLALQLNLLIPQRLIAYNLLVWLYLPWAFAIAVLLYFRVLRAETGPLRMVARGYLSGLICLFVKRIFGVSYVFDPRSLYPLESVTAGLLRKGGPVMHFWLTVERWVVRNAEKTVCVSDGMVRYFRRRHRYETTVLIPCFSVAESASDLTAEEALAGADLTAPSGRQDVLRRFLGIPPERQILLYFGSLNSGWNNINLYTSYIEQFPPDHYHFLLISQNKARIENSRLGRLPNITVLTMESLPAPLTLADCFIGADFGIVFMGPSHDWFTRLSVKFADYTTHGLPVLTNKWVGDAALLVRRYGLEPSRILSDDDPPPKPATPDQRAAIASWAASYFAPTNINRIAEADK